MAAVQQPAAPSKYNRIGHLRVVCRALQLGLEGDADLKREVEGDFARISAALNRHSGDASMRRFGRTNCLPYCMVLGIILRARGRRNLAHRVDGSRHLRKDRHRTARQVYQQLLRLDGTLPGGRDVAARTVQGCWRAFRAERAARREAAARRIQRACRPWLTKPVTADGKPGIVLRLLLEDLKEGGGAPAGIAK